MQIQVNTDASLASSAELIDKVQSQVEAALSHVSVRVSRVEVHLSDECAHKHGPQDIRCLLEVRLRGRRPTVTTAHEATVDAAVASAADKMSRQLQHAIERQRSKALAV
jgi:ribosome-associated translation inhibitor RaiA